ncbi:hypothetical protein [Bartonella sp. HY761]|uniref:hypothetical protein n=1 Tax=Bartonella sp. HY761 TaxID=2979330 RepID=UPI00220A9376|nr:hypothetical protein [Bartonella sp. HY761]UXN07148.1 hypothetical protein N6A79_03825 [Bartonella sp. HY761]
MENPEGFMAVIKAAELFLANVELFTKQHWLASYGELQLQYNELPLWILISAEASVCEAHHQLLKLYEPFQIALSSVQLNIYFYRKQADSRYCQFFIFPNTKDFLNAQIDGEILTEETYDRLEKYKPKIFNKNH